MPKRWHYALLLPRAEAAHLEDKARRTRSAAMRSLSGFGSGAYAALSLALIAFAMYKAGVMSPAFRGEPSFSCSLISHFEHSDAGAGPFGNHVGFCMIVLARIYTKKGRIEYNVGAPDH